MLAKLRRLDHGTWSWILAALAFLVFALAATLRSAVGSRPGPRALPPRRMPSVRSTDPAAGQRPPAPADCLVEEFYTEHPELRTENPILRRVLAIKLRSLAGLAPRGRQARIAHFCGEGTSTQLAGRARTFEASVPTR